MEKARTYTISLTEGQYNKIMQCIDITVRNPSLLPDVERAAMREFGKSLSIKFTKKINNVQPAKPYN